jgi:hypothetical protein
MYTVYVYMYICIYTEREIVLSNSSFASHLQTSPEMQWILGFPSHVWQAIDFWRTEAWNKTKQCKTRCGKLGWMMMDTLYHINHIIISTSPCSKQQWDGWLEGVFLFLMGRKHRQSNSKFPRQKSHRSPSFRWTSFRFQMASTLRESVRRSAHESYRSCNC